jgi:two-component system, OmpR family, sensor kinase
MSAALVPPDAETATQQPRSRRHGFVPRSLTARLVTGVVALLVILVAGVEVSTYFALGSFLGNRLDQQLSATANQPMKTLFGGDNFGQIPSAQDVYVVAISTDGSRAYQASHPPRGVKPMWLTGDTRQRLTKLSPGQAITIQTTDSEELRVQTGGVIVAPLSNGEQVPVIPVIGLSTSEEHRTLATVLKDELIIGAAAILLALLATTYWVQLGLRRLRQVTATANEVAAELSPTGTGLDRRVEVDDAETEVGQLAQSMNTLLSAVETQFAARLESEARLRQFLADASHELRTPLTSIRGYAELARMQKAAGESHEDNLARIESEGTRMSRLVEDLLMLARGDRGHEPVLELIDVAELVEDAVNGTRAAFADRVVDTRLTAGLHVVGDRDQLLRAVRNLLTNAAVHTDPQRPILATSAEQAGQVVIQIVDGGPGLPPEQAAQVFERFWRADKARSRASGGSGLGMSIVASIVAAHGGAVYFDSSVEHGSTATITLPAIS